VLLLEGGLGSGQTAAVRGDAERGHAATSLLMPPEKGSRAVQGSIEVPYIYALEVSWLCTILFLFFFLWQE